MNDPVEAALTPQADAAPLDPEARYFDPDYYCDTYPDVVTADVEPLHHYRHWGALEGRNPNAFFAAEWYLLQNPDVLEAGINPLQHYALYGAREGRNPHPRFDASFYVNQVPEAAADPLLYHLRTGRLLGLPTERRFNLAEAMPSAGTPHEPPSGLRVDVVIPVYRGLDATRRCLRSLLRDPKPGLRSPLHRIIVIDDASPEPALSRYLDRLAARRFIHLLRNPSNLGFVASVNRGIAEAGARDVVLLNADTEVPAGWLTRLAGQAYSHARVATVSPFSNNATLCSYPAVEGGPLPFGETLARIDGACLAANAGRSVTVPTTVGFCMYLRRDALDELGAFDAETFGRGYGEENDYCMRASTAGWRHLLACDLFVYHEGEVSFGGNAPERAASIAPLEARWPDYRRRVGIHVRLDEARPFRVAATLQLFATNGLPTILAIQHAYDGGVGHYVRALATQCHGVANLLVLRATMDGQGVRLGAAGVRRHPELLIPLRPVPETDAPAIDAPAIEDGGLAAAAGLLADILALLAPLRIARVHVQHWVNLAIDLRALIRALDVPYDLTIHDWFAICPRINLLPLADGPSCGEPAPAVCDRCIQARDDTAAHDIIGWRAEQAWLPRLADRVLCATQDSIDRLARHGLAARAVLAPLEAMPDAVPQRPRARADPAPLSARAKPRPLRVAVLGVLADHKGARAVTALAELAPTGQFAITLIGKAERAVPAAARHCFSETGAYEAAELPDLIARVDPDVIWFPASWPETWSYTLTAAILSGRAIVASDIGAFRHRLTAHPRARLVSPQALPEIWIEALAAMARAESAPPGDRRRRAPPPPVRPGFYEGAYQAPLAMPSIRAAQSCAGKSCAGKSRGLTDLRVPGKRAVVLVPERLDIGVLSPCAYIRMLLPLAHPAAGRDIEVTLASAEEALSLQADLILAHRYAVPDQAAAGALLAHASRTGAPFIFDLDDDLVKLPPDHPELDRLGPRAETVTALLAGADRVHVSTPLLAERVAPFVRGGIGHIQLVPNGLDERLWCAATDLGDPLGAALASAGVAPRPVRILYMGTATHGADLDTVLPALARLAETFGDRIAIEIVGITGPGGLPPFIRRVEVPSRAGLSYPAFVAWLTDRQRRQPWSIGIAPLADTSFNRCKSSIKMLDYAALGLATVVSDMPAYRDTAYGDFAQPLGAEGALAGGYLAADTAQWFHAVARLVRRPDLRLAMARLGHAAWLREGTLAAQAAARAAALDRALPNRRSPPGGCAGRRRSSKRQALKGSEVFASFFKKKRFAVVLSFRDGTAASGVAMSSPPAPALAEGQAVLHHADCFDWLDRCQPASIHAVITDPPYGLIEYSPQEQSKLRAGRGGVWRIPPAFDGHKRAPLPRFTTLSATDRRHLHAFFLRLAVLLGRAVVPGANIMVASNPLLAHIVASAMAEGGLEVRGTLIRLTMTMRGGDRPKNAHTEFDDVSVMPRSMWEPWVLLRRPLEGRVQDNLRRWKTGGFLRLGADRPFGDVIRSGPTPRAERLIAPHPSLKPQSFLRHIVRAALPRQQGVILDPFAGAGSTLAAANAVGYTSIGVEVDETYVALARTAIPALSALPWSAKLDDGSG